MTKQNTLTGITACVFDAYGTLFDVHSAVRRYSNQIKESEAVSALWRAKQLEYTWLRSLMGRYVDFWQVTADALDFALETYGISDTVIRQDLLQAYMTLSCYSEVPDVLDRLKRKGIRCAILSNGSPQMLSSAVKNSGLSEFFDAVISVDMIGQYKPDPRVYRLAVDELKVEKSKIAFQSSNAWDAAGANAYGFNVVWVNRFKQKHERLNTSVDIELTDLEKLPELL
ncbi:haloacid dehalogenase type II [Gammaproteobacteria bacterium]|jgi:2-haloacid dehalogenase|nr:haloacid dehalogenase type II [Gammaproteobacteria bacterium]